MKNLLIIGTGGFAREVYWHAQNSIGYGEEFLIKGFLEGNVPLAEHYELPLPVLGKVENYVIEENDVFVVAIAGANVKKIIVEMLLNKGAEFINLIHKTAMVSSSAELGKGIIICPFVMISCNTIVGNHVMFNAYSSLGHDAQIGDFSSTMGHVDITGNVKAGIGTYWGSGSRALPSSKIGDYAKVGASSVVLRKVKAGETVFGIPAMPI